MSFKEKYNIQTKYLTPRSKRRPGHSIPEVKFVVAHDTGNPGSTALGNVNYYQRSRNEISASAHLFVDDKNIVECIPALNAPPEKAWHVLYHTPHDNQLFGFNANDAAIGVEYCYGGKIDADEAYRRYVWLLAFLCFHFQLDAASCIVGHHILDPLRKTDPVTGLIKSRRSYDQLLLDVVTEYNSCLGIHPPAIKFTQQSGKVKTTARLHIRANAPNTSAQIITTAPAFAVLDFSQWTNEGQSINGVSKWYGNNENEFFWSGVVDELQADEKKNAIEHETIDADGTVITNVKLNIRDAMPSTLAPIREQVNKGVALEYTGITYQGERIQGNSTWYRNKNGDYFWSGGVSTSPPVLPHQKIDIETPKAPTEEKLGWGLQQLKIYEIWEFTQGAGVKAAVLDTGVDINHPDLKAAIFGAENFINKGHGVDDQTGHGTHCAGIIAAQGIKLFGVAPKVALYVGKVAENNGSIKEKAIIEGIDWAIAEKVDILSISLTLEKGSEQLKEKVKEAFYNGILLVSAVGNEGQLGFEVNNFPAFYDECISVGAVDRFLKRSAISTKSKSLDLLAPGEEIYSTWLNSGYSIQSGSSMAVPFVAGVAALLISYLKSAGKPFNVQEIKHLIESTASDYGVLGFDAASGYGIVNALNLFSKIKNIPV